MTITFDETKIFSFTERISELCDRTGRRKICVPSVLRKRLNSFSQVANYPRQDNAFAPNPFEVPGRVFSLATLPQEFPGNGSGDFRESAFECLYPDQTTVSLLTYKSHDIVTGKQPLQRVTAYLRDKGRTGGNAVADDGRYRHKSGKSF